METSNVGHTQNITHLNTEKNFDNNLAGIWPVIKSLIEDGVSLIPVREIASGDRPAKTPTIRSWKQWQSERMTEGDLWREMELGETMSFAAVCGEVSGRLECIDIDSKYNPGIEALVIKDIREMYPDLYPLLRIHSTPSGGRHIIYRIEDHDVEGNQKLAGRGTTGAEKQAQLQSGRKRIANEVNFLETRGEGGYFVFPPSMGYNVVQNVPIPSITWEERCSLINLCRSYDEVVRVTPNPDISKHQNDNYLTNPFEDFNEKCDPIVLMEEFGWKPTKHYNSRFYWFTRPGKDYGVSVSFNREKRVFFMFTSSTEFIPDKGYNPSTILAQLKFNGDKKKAFKYLIDMGYGQVKRAVEQSIIKKAAITGTGIPANFSDQAKKDFADMQSMFQENYPYGWYWKMNKEGKPEISYSKYLHVSEHLGYRLYNGEIVQIDGKFINRISTRDFIEGMLSYIKEEDDTDLLDAFEKFNQSAFKNIESNRLKPLEVDLIVCDSINVCYKFFENCVVEIYGDRIIIKQYDEVDGLIFSDKIIPRKYEPSSTRSDLFEQYLINATDIKREQVSAYVQNVIGWLCHDFNSPASIYFVVMTEMVINPKEGGGSGKNIFANLLSSVIGMSTASGSMVKWDDKFFSVWKPGTRIYFIPDLPKQIDWSFLKNAVENPLINKKYIKEFSVTTEEAPKLLFNTNYSFDDVDGGVKRRIRPIEFTDFYTRHGGVDIVHGKLFPHDWADEDWNGFFDFVIKCIQLNLVNNCKIERMELSQDGLIKKFISNHGERYYNFFNEYIKGWCSKGFVSVPDFNTSLSEYFTGEKTVSGTKLNDMLEEFCVLMDIEFEKNTKRQGVRGRHFKLKQFMDDDDIPF